MLHLAFLDWLWHAIRWTYHDPDGYNIISGPIADVTLIGGAYAIIRRHNCHVRGCWRIGRHKVAGTEHIVCRHHHPHPAPTAAQVLADHAAARHPAVLTAAGAAAAAGAVAEASSSSGAASGGGTSGASDQPPAQGSVGSDPGEPR